MIAFGDIRDVSAARLMAELGRLPDVIVGSPPCQDASAANHAGEGLDGDRTGLFLDALRLVGECRPSLCTFENVPGLTARGLDRVIRDLAAQGYATDVCVIGADDLGAPHRRKRLWVIGIRNDLADAYEGRRESFGLADAFGGGGEGAFRDHPVGRGGEGIPADADGGELRVEPRRSGGQGGSDPAQSGLSGAAAPANAPGIGLPEWESLGFDFGEEQPATDGSGSALDAVLAEYPHWNGGPATIGLFHDGARPLIPRRGFVRATIAAVGDAIVPQVAELIGRTLRPLLPADREPEVLDLFAGAVAGFSIGLHRAGFRTVAICELDPWRRAVAVAHLTRAAA